METSSSYRRQAISKNPYMFNGGVEYNEDTEWYETAFRQYDPAIGRFGGIDPMTHQINGINPYQFAYNDPVSFNDPTGLMPNGGGQETLEESQGFSSSGGTGWGNFLGARNPGSTNDWTGGFGEFFSNTSAKKIFQGISTLLNSEHGGTIDLTTGTIIAYDGQDDPLLIDYIESQGTFFNIPYITEDIVEINGQLTVLKTPGVRSVFVKNGIDHELLVDRFQDALGIFGLLPIIGEPADALNATIYLARGDKTNAALSAAALIPIVGIGAGIAAIVSRGVRNGTKALVKIKVGKWGNLNKYGGEYQTAIEHISAGHFFNSRIGQKTSRFLQAYSNAGSVKKLTNEAISLGRHSGSAGNYSVTHTFNHIIGTTSSGRNTKRLKVYLDQAGNVLNSYPIR